jgi:hypothetical protein
MIACYFYLVVQFIPLNLLMSLVCRLAIHARPELVLHHSRPTHLRRYLLHIIYCSLVLQIWRNPNHQKEGELHSIHIY